MNVILCTASTRGGNDQLMDGAVHFELKSAVHETDALYALYRPERKFIEIRGRNKTIRELHPSGRGGRSARRNCIGQLADFMKPGDCLCAISLSDLGDTAEEAESAYYEFRRKGIVLSFFDASHLDTSVIGIGSDPQEILGRLLHSFIDLYYNSKSGRPALAQEELDSVLSIPFAKKKSPLGKDQGRSHTSAGDPGPGSKLDERFPEGGGDL